MDIQTENEQNKPPKHNQDVKEYERQKRVIQKMDLSSSEYERAINRLAERLGV